MCFTSHFVHVSLLSSTLLASLIHKAAHFPPKFLKGTGGTYMK